ncbi:MAG: ChaN family lipoprotein [Desulfomonilaceae bacterium]|nr:ChaN family lipoprotein [Desulfomonilaceae bacterium]
MAVTGLGKALFLIVLMSVQAAATAVYAQESAMSDCKSFIVDVLAGEPVPMEMMVDDLASVRIVYVGEVHTIDRHHELQTEILRVLSQRGLKLALGMEMFSVRQQEILDRWQRGDGSVASLIHDLGKGHWTNLLDYESVLLTARKLHVPILGINADDALVKKVARHGIRGLSDAEQREAPRGFDRINPVNDRLLRLKLRVHRAFEGKSLDRIVLAQALRDETMARAIVRFLDSPEGKDRTMMVIAGSGHLNYGLGIPERVRRRGEITSRIILPSESGELVLSESEKRQAVPVEITHKDLLFINKPIADYLHLIPLRKKSEEPPAPTSAPEMDQARLTDP